MQRWCQWQLEPLLRLVMGICLVLGASGIGTLALMKIMGSDQGVVGFPAMILHTLIFHGGVIGLVALFLKEQGLSFEDGFGIRFNEWRRLMGPILLTTVACLVSAQILGRLSGQVIEWQTGEEPAVQSAIDLLRNSTSPLRLIYLGVVTIILAPIAEEFLFRGILYTAIQQYQGRAVALAANSVLFGLIHSNLLTLVPLIVMAVMLTILYEKSRSLLAPMAAHSLFNLANFVMLMMGRDLS